MRVNMSKHYSMGFDFWRIPLSANEQLMQDMTSLIELENEFEEILGDRLKREQLNFMYDVLKIVYDGHSRKKLLSKSEKILCLSIPKLVALKSLERIYEVFQAKYTEVSTVQKYKQHDIEPPKPLIDFALMSALNPREVKTHQGLLPQGHEFKEEIHLANDKNYTIEMNDNSIPDLDKYGRFFIWPDYVPEEMWDEICENAKLLRHINRAALHDLEDFIIVQGMEASSLELRTMRRKYSLTITSTSIPRPEPNPFDRTGPRGKQNAEQRPGHGEKEQHFHEQATKCVERAYVSGNGPLPEVQC
jgi:hypothetical protein